MDLNLISHKLISLDMNHTLDVNQVIGLIDIDPILDLITSLDHILDLANHILDLAAIIDHALDLATII